MPPDCVTQFFNVNFGETADASQTTETGPLEEKAAENAWKERATAARRTMLRGRTRNAEH